MSPLEDLGLLPAQGAVDPVARDLGVAGRPPLGRHSAVVAGEDDKRVVGHLEPVERVEHFAHRPVEFVDEVAIDADLARAREARVRLQRRVDVAGAR